MRTKLLALAAVLVILTSAGCYDPNRIVGPDEVLLVTATPSAIPANGFSRSTITAKVNTTVNRNVTVTFSTSGGGTLSSTTARGPDGNGEVSVFLTSDATPKTVSVTAEVKDGAELLVSRSVIVTFDAAAADSVLRLIAATSQVEADGVSSVLLRAESNPAAATRTVSFTTTNGSFVRDANPAVTAQNNVAVASDGVAHAQLFAPLIPGSALVTATSSGFSASQTITFTPALPDFITLQASPLTVSRADEDNLTNLTAVLSRAVGTVSRSTRVDFTIVNDASGESFGRFQNITRSNEAETVTAQFVPGTAAPLGLATITARVPGSNVTAQVKINVTM
jgi:hypothetical protein